MRRLSPTSPTARQLRQEVNFACPSCGQPVLTYHHFDPPWREREHNDPNGIVALCPLCHNEAEGGKWTKRELHEFKRNAPVPGVIRKSYGWKIGPEQSIFYRLGGNYASSAPNVISINGRPILWEDRSPEGFLLFSLDVLSSDGSPMLEIRENSLSVDALDLWDVHLTTDGNHIVVRPRKGEIALDLRWRRVSLDQFRSMLEEDIGTSGFKLPQLPDGSMPDWLRDIKSPPDLAINHAKEKALDGDGNLVVIDIENASLRSGARVLTIRNGLSIEGFSSKRSCISIKPRAFSICDR